MTYTLATKQSVQAETGRNELPGGDVRPIAVAAKPSSLRSHVVADGAVGLAAGTLHRMLTIASLVLLTSCGDAATADVEPPVGPPGTRTATGLRVAGITADSMTEFPVTSGDTLPQAITAQLVDASGTAVPQSGVRVTVALRTMGDLPLPGARILSADTATTSSDGIATFRGLAVSGLATTGRLVFVAPSLAPVRLAIRLRAGAASMSASAVTVLPDTVPVGGASQVAITLLDAAGNRLGAGETVAVAMGGGTSAATPSATTFNGADSTYRLTLTGVTAGTPTTITATVGGRALAATRQLTIVAPIVPPVPATRLAFSLIPGDTTAGIVVRSGTTLSQAVAELRSASNTTVAQAGITISASLTNASGGALSGGTITGAGPVSTSGAGSAAFPAIGVSGRVGQARVQMTSPGLSGISFPITIAAGAVNAGLTTLTVSADTVPVGSTSVVTLLPRDAQSNLLGSGQAVSVTATGGTATGTVGTAIFTTSDSSYRATFTGTAVGTAMTVRAVAAGVSVTQSRTVRVTAGPVSTSSSTLAVSADSIPVGGSSVVTVTPRDAAGNKRGAGLVVSVTATGGTSVGSLSAVTYNASDSSYRSTFSGTTAGTALTVRATVTGVALTATRLVTVRAAAPPPPPPPPGDTTWTYCSTTGAICSFIGLRDVRLRAPNGQVFVDRRYGSIPCAPNYDGEYFKNAPSANYTVCEYGPILLSTLANPFPGMSGLNGSTVTVFQGDSGWSTMRITPTTTQPTAPQDHGDFRTTCAVSSLGFFDPIVFPGQANSAHLHMFFGNTGINPNSTVSSIASTGNGTCMGGTANRTGYWIPAMFDPATQQVIVPELVVVYYKTGYNFDTQTMQDLPAGLRMIAGNKNNTSGIQMDPSGKLEVVSYTCGRTVVQNTGRIPNCPVGDYVNMVVTFPQCWDGVNLDSPNHQSHMSYPVFANLPARSTCPPSHPVPLPQIEEIFRFTVLPGANPTTWRLSSDMYSNSLPGGASAHADWMNGWDPATFRAILNNCLRPGRDCGVGLLGDGRRIF